MPVILALSSAFILDEWGPRRAAEFYFLWRASELAMTIPTSFSIASLVHRGHGRIIESVWGLSSPMIISSLSSLFVLIGLLIMLPMFDGLFRRYPVFVNTSMVISGNSYTCFDDERE